MHDTLAGLGHGVSLLDVQGLESELHWLDMWVDNLNDETYAPTWFLTTLTNFGMSSSEKSPRQSAPMKTSMVRSW
jgi:hypothetical protein